MLPALALLALSACADSPPVFVETDLLTATDDPAGPYEVRAIVVDDRGVEKVTLVVVDGRAPHSRLPMRHEGDHVWVGRLPVLPRSASIGYYMVATDILNQEATAPDGAPATIFGLRMTASPLDDGRPPFDGEGEGEGDAPGEGEGEGGDPGPAEGEGEGEGEGQEGEGEGVQACTVEIRYPRRGVTLDPRDDDFDPDTAGLQTPVSAVTDALDGTRATLVVGGGATHETTAQGGLVEIDGVTLPVGDVTLELRVGAEAPCTAKTSVGVLDEGGRPECAADADCFGDGAVCFRGNCIGLMACETLDDCPAGMICHRNTCTRPQDLPADACAEDADCLSGLVCAFGLCTPESCRDDDDCLADERCFLEECITEDLPAPDTCIDDADCGPGDQCLAGLCIGRECFSDEDCPAGSPNCFSGFCLGFRPPVGECRTDEDCGGNQQCFLGEICLPGFLPLPDSCRTPDDCEGGAAENVCILGACIRADCQVKADCAQGQDCRFGFCIPEDLPLPLPGTCGQGRPPCPEGSSCLFSICIPDAVPIPRPCGPDGSCPSERQQCIFGVFCFGF